MEYNFEKYSTSEIDTSLPYDYESIMHYPRNAFSKNGRDTMIKLKSGPEIGNKNELSQIDISGIRKLYNCNYTFLFKLNEIFKPFLSLL